MNYTGLAKIIPFTPRAPVRVGPPWTTAELGELFRVAHVLRQSGMSVETDMGLSDEGDPWFVFYSVQSEDVIAHFARIDGEILVHGLSAGGVVSGVDLRDVVRRLQPVQAMERHQASRTDRSVVLHPFMLLVAFVAASFLATEESQAAAPADRAGPKAEAAETALKTKTDWIDRAMALLYGKTRDQRTDASEQEALAARKSAAGDALQHSMALVMLAAAISQAQADVLSSDDVSAQDAGQDLKAGPDLHKQAADGAVAALGAAATDALALASGQSAAAAQPHEGRLSPEAAAALPPADDGASWTAPGVPAAGPAVAVSPLPAAQAEVPAGPVVPLLSAQDYIPLPEIVPVAVKAAAAPAAAAPAKTGALTQVSAAPSALTSFDITFEGGTLQFHQSSVDIRLIEVVASRPDAQPGETAPASPQSGASPQQPAVKTLVLTDAQENVLVETGEIRIKNFAFGIDHLVIQDALLAAQQPEVLFSTAGDIIIVFGDVARVVLLGVFEPSQMIAGVASVASV